MNKMNGNGKEKNNCHYRDCEAITNNLSRIKNKKRNVTARSAQVRTSKRNVMPILPAGKIQGIFKLNKIIGRSLEKIFKKIFRDDLSFPTPAALEVQRHSEPQAKNPEKNTFKDWILRFAFAPLRMTIPTLTLVAVLSFGMVKETWADGCPSGAGSCGTDCCWNYDTTTKELSFFAAQGASNVSIEDYDYWMDESDAPWSIYANEAKSVNVGEGIVHLGNGTFTYFQKLENVSLADSVKSIDIDVFQGTSSLTSIDMPGVEYIGPGAFYDSGNNLSIYMPNVKTIESGAFVFADLDTIDMPNLETMNEWAFDQAQLCKASMPNLVTIGHGAFEVAGCGPDRVTQLEISDSLLYASDWAFEVMDNLELIIPDSLDTSKLVESTFSPYYPDSKVTFKCKGDQSVCEEKLKKFIMGDPAEGYCGEEWSCIPSGNVTFAGIDDPEECNSGMYEWDLTSSTCKRMGENSCNETDRYYYNGNTCTRRPKNGQVACSSSYKVNDGYCDRIRYTPAEAAKVLHDDNTNSVTITFKK